MAQYPANIDLSSLNGTNGFKLSGETSADGSGSWVASAGDVNGDGFADVIVGAPNADANGLDSGASYVVFGKASGFGANLDLSTLNGVNGFQISGVRASSHSGVSVASTGDINGDGFADVIVRGTDIDSHGLYTGVSYVVFGKASGFAADLNLSGLDGTNGFKVSPTSGGSIWLGAASAGDVNGDGIADFILGDRSLPVNGNSTVGVSYVVFGKASGFGANVNVSSLDGTNGFKLSGFSDYSYTGASVASAGDVNGDGFADVIVGAYGVGGRSGTSYVVFGKASGFAANLSVNSLNGANGFAIKGVAVGDYSGWSVASAGDVNGDGFADVIVGAERADPNGTNSGASYVVFGKASGFTSTLNVSTLNGTNGFKISGSAAGEYSGFSVASAGDVNGDGFADVIVGVYRADPHGVFSGASYVVFGKASGFAANINLSSLDGTNGFQLSGVALRDYSGRSVASAGDVNGDGLADLIVGAGGADSNGTDSGASYVVYGRLPDTAVDRTGTDAAQSLVGGNFDDHLDGRGGNDNLFGHGGDDTIEGGSGDDTIHGGPGNDHLDGGDGIDTADYSDAGSGVTVDLSLVTAQDTGGGGVDTLIRIENLTGSGFADLLKGTNGANVLTGLAGDDTLRGVGGDDVLFGGDGDDILNGGLGADQMSGGAGNDFYRVDNTGDQIFESANGGDDEVKSTATYTLGANVENLILTDTAAIDGTGNALDNKLVGNDAANVLSGLDGDDRLLGGGDDDTLIGGSGRDVMTGGSGADTFVFLAASDSGFGDARDVITDFETGDRIDLSAIDADVGTPLDDGFGFIGSAAFSGHAGELRAVVIGSNTVIAGDINGNGHADFQIIVASDHVLDAGDFRL